LTNPVKGEVAFEAAGKSYKFVLGSYGLAALERRQNKSISKIFDRKDGDFGVDDILAIFHAGLLRHHGLSEVEASDVLDAIGHAEAGRVVSEAVSLAFPQEDETPAERPRRAAKAASTG